MLNSPVGADYTSTMVEFDAENGTDTANAMESASRALKDFKWVGDDLPFYFQQIEARMASAGVKKQFSKFQILSTILPQHVILEVKQILRKKEADLQNKAYKTLKDEILRIFGPRVDTNVAMAFSRTLGSGKPSQLARALVNDLCKTDLENCDCCPPMVLYLLKRQCPLPVRTVIAQHEFNFETFDAVVELADEVFDTCRPSGVSVAAMSAVPQVSLDETQPAIPYAIPSFNMGAPGYAAAQAQQGIPGTVAAIQRGAGRGRGFRGQGRGGRSRGGRGGATQASASSSSDSTSGQVRRGPRHPDLPAGIEVCQMHHRWAANAHFCQDPLVCPWASKIAPRK